MGGSDVERQRGGLRARAADHHGASGGTLLIGEDKVPMVRGQNLRFARSSLSASGLRFRRIAKEQALAEFYVPIQKGLVERRLSHGALNILPTS
jgi:hypothetical protein